MTNGTEGLLSVGSLISTNEFMLVARDAKRVTGVGTPFDALMINTGA